MRIHLSIHIQQSKLASYNSLNFIKIAITHFFLLAFLCVNGQNKFTPLNIDSKIPDYAFKIVEQNNITQKRLSGFKGKVVIIDFWATWCAPCVEHMQELNNLYKPFNADITVLAISDEPVNKIRQFAKNTAYTFFFISDSSFSNYFPHKVIPHTVIIDREGKIAAITYPEEITSSVLYDLVNDIHISLAYKNDFQKPINGNSVQDLYKFEVTKYDPQKSTAIFETEDSLEINNFTLPSLFREVFKMPAQSWIIDSIRNRTISEYIPANLYCLKLYKKIPSKVSLYKIGQAITNTTFAVKARKIMIDRFVYVLEVSDKSKLQQSGTSLPVMQFYGPNYEGLNQPISSLVDYLSNEKGYLEDAPVIDETGLEGKYDIKLNWAYEKPETLNEALKQYGLILKQEKRKINCLVLSD